MRFKIVEGRLKNIKEKLKSKMLPKKKLIKLLKYLGEASFIFVLIAKFALLILWEIRSLNI